MTISIRTSMTLVLFVLAGSIPACAADLGPEDEIVGVEESELSAARIVEDEEATAATAVLWCDASSPTHVSGVHQCTYDLRGTTFSVPTPRRGFATVVIPGSPFTAQCACTWGNTSGDPSCQPGQLPAGGALPTCPATDTTWVTFQTVSTNPAQCSYACANAVPSYDLDYGCCS